MTGKRDFVRGAAILSISGLLVKLLGAALRIPLTNKLGDGMAYYNVAYSIYSIFLVLSTAGTPVAISRLVSERMAVGNLHSAHRVFSTAVKLMWAIGIASFSICFFGAEFIAEIIEIPEAALSLRAIAPALCIVPLLSAFRGYFQGQQNMLPTAASEISEQVVRVAVGLTLSFMLFDQGLPMAAAGATFGAAAGAAAGIVVMLAIYWFHRKKNRPREKKDDREPTGFILKKIVWIAVPIIIGAEIMPIMSTIDTSLIVSRLQATGWEYADALNLYSQYGSYCDTLISLPQTFTQAIGVSLVPSIAAFFWQKKMDKVRENMRISMRLTMIMACPCAVGLFALAEPILLLLYPQQAESALAAASILRIMTAGIVLLAISQTLTGALQSINRQITPVKNLAIGACIKAGLTYMLVGLPAVNVKGAAIGTNAAYLTALLLNLFALKKRTGVRFPVLQTFVKPAAASLIMGVWVRAVCTIAAGSVGIRMAAVISIFAGILMYVVLIVRLKVISGAELRSLPCGAFLAKVFRV